MMNFKTKNKYESKLTSADTVRKIKSYTGLADFVQRNQNVTKEINNCDL